MSTAAVAQQQATVSHHSLVLPTHRPSALGVAGLCSSSSHLRRIASKLGHSARSAAPQCSVLRRNGQRSIGQVLARDAPHGARISDTELIVLGLSPEGQTTATPLAATCASSPFPSPLPADTVDLSSSDPQLPVLRDVQPLPACARTPDLFGQPSVSEVRTAAAPIDRSNNADVTASRSMFVATSPLAPVITPTGLMATQLGSDGASPDTPDGQAFVAQASAVVISPAVSVIAAELGVISDQGLASSSVPVAVQLDSSAEPPHSNGNGKSHAAAEAAAASTVAPAASAAAAMPAPAPQLGLWDRLQAKLATVQWMKVWALALLSISYVHQATTGFALPAMLPMISNELHLTDLQGALLTTGYSYLYAVALVPIGLLADRVSRPKLLACGLALWSVLTCTASTCRSFNDLLLARVGFAAAQGAQNPVCFSLIPELFPVNKSTALSIYNCAIYVGRALSFAAVLLARHLHDNDQVHLAARGGALAEPLRLNHLDRADLHSMSIMHTAGDMAAATPDREFNFPLWEYGSELPDSAWRQVLRWIAIPGFLIGLAMLFTLQEPRQASASAATAQSTPAAVAATATTTSSSAATPSITAPPLTGAATPAATTATSAAAPTTAAPSTAPASASASSQSAAASAQGILSLLRSPGFMSVTLAAALNDVGSYALIAWQSTFYERVYGLSSSAYAPVLAILLPIGGILGGVGGGYLADRLSRSGRRWMVTAGATCLAAPCLAASCLAPTPELSYAALLVGFALSEAWRAPSAVMARGIAPASMGSSASALYLCVRNLLGGLGPLLVAGLIRPVGLQHAMMVVPAMYLGSGIIFAKAEKLYDAEMAAKAKVAAA